MNRLADIDREKLRKTLLDLLPGIGLGLVYFMMAALAAVLTGGFIVILFWLLARIWLSLAIVGSITLAIVVGIILWWLAFRMTVEFLDETGIEVRPNFMWFLLPVAPPLWIILGFVHLFASLGARASKAWRLVGYVMGIVLLFAIAVAVVAFSI